MYWPYRGILLVYLLAFFVIGSLWNIVQPDDPEARRKFRLVAIPVIALVVAGVVVHFFVTKILPFL